jgi:hypothetical protein
MNHESTVEQFRDELINQARVLAAGEIGFTDQAFAQLAGERLVSAEELGSFESCHVRSTGKSSAKLKLDGYHWDEDDDSLRLVVVRFDGDATPQTITKSNAEGEFKAVRAFIEHSMSGWCKANLAPTSEGFRLSEDIRVQAGKGEIARVRVFLVTEGMLSERVKDWPDGTIAGIPIDYRIWDVGRLFEVERSTAGREAIEVDFTSHPGGGVPILAVNTNSADYRGYLGQMSGAVLAEIYERYGSRLLEGNVRAFLSARGKVNKGIQTTIMKQPEMFFAFNNGIATTASAVDLGRAPDGTTLLLRATNLQIVNGGQTTASLAFALRKSNANLGGIAVAMKLSVVSESRASEITPLISKFANSQNKVSDADLWSNHAFHRRVEQLSRTLLAPAVNGKQYQTRWYYERARGQYQSDLGRCRTNSTRRTFEDQHPKDQLFSKETLAKVENAWLQHPHIVCLGGQKNFLRFANQVIEEWDKDDTKFNEVYFKRVVGKMILHRAAESAAVQARLENRGIKAHIANYAVASIAKILSASGRDVHWELIWREQGLTPDWQGFVELVVAEVVPIMTRTDSDAIILTQWFKNQVLWTRVCDRLRSVPLPHGLKTISTADSLGALKDAKSAQVISTSLDEMKQVMSIGTSGWNELSTWLQRNAGASPVEMRLVDKFSSRNSPPSEVEASKLMAVLNVAVQRGFEPGHPSTQSALGR